MPLVAAGDLVRHAAASGRGVLAFNAVTLEHAEAIVEGAERAGGPVILAVSHNAIRFHGALEPLAAGCRSLARSAGVGVGLHLDHIEEIEWLHRAGPAGFTSVMFDGSRLDDEANRRATAEAVVVGHVAGLWLEAEIGEIGGKNGLHAPGARTDPTEAADFAGTTGVDALAVAVGTSHAMATPVGGIDLGLISRLRHAVGVPLVLHGSSGLSDELIVAAVRAGMVKINVGTQLNVAWSAAVAGHLGRGPDPRPGLTAAREAMGAVVRRLMLAVAGSYRAEL